MFNSGRLAVARKRRQQTKKELALKARVSQLTITRLENGETPEPSEDTVEAIARALEYPVGFFYLDDCEELPPESVSFRSLSSLTARQRDAALASGTIAFLLDDWVTERFNLPKPDLLDLRDESPAGAAAALRDHWGLGSRPIPHMTRLLEAKGIRVFSLSEQNKNVDAFSCWRGESPYIFLNTFKSAERSRFDAAHELAHLSLHRHSVQRDVERDADQFASAFLVPRGDLISNMPRVSSLTQLVRLKDRWGVSVSALARTCFDAGLVSDWHYRDLCKRMSTLGYRSTEPSPKAREESVLWKKVFESLWKDRLTKAHVAKALCLPQDEIEALLGGLYGDAAAMPTGETFRLRAVS